MSPKSRGGCNMEVDQSAKPADSSVLAPLCFNYKTVVLPLTSTIAVWSFVSKLLVPFVHSF